MGRDRDPNLKSRGHTLGRRRDRGQRVREEHRQPAGSSYPRAISESLQSRLGRHGPGHGSTVGEACHNRIGPSGRQDAHLIDARSHRGERSLGRNISLREEHRYVAEPSHPRTNGDQVHSRRGHSSSGREKYQEHISPISRPDVLAIDERSNRGERGPDRDPITREDHRDSRPLCQSTLSESLRRRLGGPVRGHDPLVGGEYHGTIDPNRLQDTPAIETRTYRGKRRQERGPSMVAEYRDLSSVGGNNKPGGTRQDLEDRRVEWRNRGAPREASFLGSELSGEAAGLFDGDQRGVKRRRYDGRHGYEVPAKKPRRNTNPMGTRMLRILQSEESPDILQQLYENMEPLEMFLEGGISDDDMKLFIDVLSKMCSADDQRSERAKDILQLLQEKYFLQDKLTVWISKWEVLISAKEECEKIVLLLTDVISSMLRQVPDAEPFIRVVVNLLNDTIKRFEDEGISDEVVVKLATLQPECLGHSLESAGVEPAECNQNVPDDFREIPILPLPCELRHDYRPMLRTNIVGGKYENANHYLDIHFRLLREDFVQPLREGIAEYTENLARERGKSKKRFQNIRIYTEVRAVASNASEDGLSVVLQFDVENNLKRIRWGNSKRLIFGSLVCLSRDNFVTSLFGVVCNRSIKDLQHGKIEVKFVLGPEQALELFSHSFIMAESDSYFEAYRYILRCLQVIDEKSFPFKQYVINMARNPSFPTYLTSSSLYDLSSLEVKKQSRSFTRNLKNVCLSADVSWPSADILGLDESQMMAFHAALTQQFCLIQGPPGTGKTYVGLKIVETLLKNKELWGQRKPLLVVCYTNHALDQFLEGILQFDKRVVRIGGRSKSEKLKNLNINQITRAAWSSLKSTISKLLRRMRALAADATNYLPLITAASKNLIKTEVLQNVMTKAQREGLQPIGWPLQDPIPFWLNLYDQNGQLIEERTCYPRRDGDYPDDSREEGELDDVQDNQNKQSTSNSSTSAQMRKNCKDDNEKEDGEIDEDISDDDYFEDRFVDDSDELFNQMEDIPIHKTMDIVMPFPETVTAYGQISFLNSRISSKLSEKSKMTQEEAENVTNVWDLKDVHDRWRLYRYWMHSYIGKIHQRFHRLFEEYNRHAAKVTELRTEEKHRALANTSVIGVTTSGAAKYNHLLKRISPPVVIVEEAAEILEAHVITSLTKNTQHLILIGDHQQLRPNPTVYKLCKDFKLDVSLFERMVKNKMPCHRLSLQHRMRPEISQILKLHKDFYPGLQDHNIVRNYDHILGVEKDVFFVDHKMTEQHDTESKSRSNIHEANFLTALCKYLLQQGYSANQITILTAYKGQVLLFKEIMDRKTFEGVRVCPVDNFQGEENDIILFSFVRSNIEGNIGFLKVSNRICVALSRAKKGLYCIGNFSMMAEKCEVWRAINDDLQARGLIGSSMKLLCSNHPEKFVKVSCSQDFRNVPDGGCQEYCNVRLNCGHSCQKRCHPRDKEHRDMSCHKPCEKSICDKNHKCPLTCSEPCVNYCKKQVKKKLPCGHEDVTFCSTNPEYVKCSNPCDRQLACGHECKLRCCEPCEQDCKEMVQKTFAPCGHQATVPCYQTECVEPCRALLKCDHQCQGTCGKCNNGRYHVKCTQECKRILVCGHFCESRCSHECPPCKKTCENRCEHSRCQKKCGEKCIPCREQCDWSCRHQTCSRHCGEECDRERCDEPCPHLLKCGHKCISLCGEPCPELCRKCDEGKVTEILFGDEDEPEARFILLESCKHIVEVNALDKLMDGNKGSDENAIKLPECPWCKTPITYSRRYRSTLNAYRRDVEKVKEKIKGEDSRIKETSSQLEQRRSSICYRKIKTRPSLILYPRKLTTSSLKEDQSLPMCVDFEEAFYRMKKVLRQSAYNLSTEDLRRIRIYLGMFEKVSDLGDDPTATHVEIQDSYQRFCDLYKFLLLKTRDQMMEGSTISDQEIHDWQREFNRCRLALDVMKVDIVFQKTQVNLDDHEKEREMMDEMNQLLSDGLPFTQEKETQVRAHLEHLKTFDPALQRMGITAEEKDIIVKAMAFNRRGHWFKCPNGHVYAIGECGGATQRSVCPECKASIGGVGHQLDGSNALAPEMDGASFAAYSEEANNLNNFDLGDII